MSEVVPIDPRVMAQDRTLVVFEAMLTEAYLDHLDKGEDIADIALNGLGAAYEAAIRSRYPFKVLK